MLKKFTLNQLLFLFFNTKIKKSQSVKDTSVPEFIANSRIINTKKSKYFNSPKMNAKVQKLWCKDLNQYYQFKNLAFKPRKTSTVRLIVPNDEHLSFEQFLDQVYKQIELKIIMSSISDKELTDLVFTSAFGFRESFDYTCNFITTDVHSTRQKCSNYITHLLNIFTNFTLEPQLNWNFRDLQKQQVDKKLLRATQLRINLRCVYNNFLPELKLVNPFRYQQFEMNKEGITVNKHLLSSHRKNDDFMSRINYQRQNLLNNQNLSLKQIDKSRQQLGFTKDFHHQSRDVRSARMMEWVRANDPDVCMGCGHKTFQYRDTNQSFFQIHHVIPFANNKKYGIDTENPDNMVKLCPNCHSALTPNRTSKAVQEKIIKHIFAHKPATEHFVEKVQKKMHRTDESPVEFDWSMLK